MIVKMVGAMLIILGCGGFGFKLASDYLKQITSLRQLQAVLNYLQSELQFRLTPLPELCSIASKQCRGTLSLFFIKLQNELDSQISPDVERCVSAALYKQSGLPSYTIKALEKLGSSLGRFDLEGQLKGIDAVKSYCDIIETELSKEKSIRVRNYRTLAICAGAALAILFM